MQLSETVEWGLHSCLALAFLPPGGRMPARLLADYHGLKPAYLAKALQKLTEAGILSATEGRAGGLALADLPEKISALAIVDALEPQRGFFQCTEIRRRGPCAAPAKAYVKPCNIAAMMGAADAAWRKVLAETSLADLKARAEADALPGVTEKTAAWLGETGALR